MTEGSLFTGATKLVKQKVGSLKTYFNDGYSISFRWFTDATAK